MGRALLLTGDPGVGKTVAILKVIERLRAEGFRVGGFVSLEVRIKGTRIGFKIQDLSKGVEGWLAHVDQPDGPRIGKYRVNLKDLDQIGTVAIEDALSHPEIHVVAVDEIGPMELFSESFKNAIKRSIEGPKPLIGIIHKRAKGPFIDALRNSPIVEVVEITYTNRDLLPEKIAQKVLGWLRERL
ncbi:MAG: NTPase [Candidatus Bathyarchaeia archaeon]